MKLIIGLGNPGEKYDGTRHNIGFAVIDELLRQKQLTMTDQKYRADYTIWRNNNERIYLLKPFTYMNLSGEAVLPFMSYFGIGMKDIIVVYDDLDLAVGKIRLRQSGSAGGHNGMKSIIEMLGSDQFNRIRIGIGRPQHGWKVVDHVLAPFTKEDQVSVNSAVEQAVSALSDWADGASFISLMNQYN
ncbi:aminoacyl-tRNA hydrolase [Fundicoccus sp. Sow4_H7]|uniref:aminoacyl-tRNA hydrolase n=1 Tax=Fundicoccus sp. Sow4_H7 TaxID=3438784 RepID=UPI003F8D9E0D